ncbi:uncharacterized protein Dvar_36860 [Desulfosarcina variabilis str. Montpellier]
MGIRTPLELPIGTSFASLILTWFSMEWPLAINRYFCNHCNYNWPVCQANQEKSIKKGKNA